MQICGLSRYLVKTLLKHTRSFERLLGAIEVREFMEVVGKSLDEVQFSVTVEIWEDPVG
jgi:hypothetical protein